MKCLNCKSQAVRLIPKKHLYICYACGATWNAKTLPRFSAGKKTVKNGGEKQKCLLKIGNQTIVNKQTQQE